MDSAFCVSSWRCENAGEAGKSLRNVAYAASILSRCPWFQDNFYTGKIIHPAKKKLTAKAAAMEDISMLFHCPTEVQRNHNGVVTALCCTITWMQSCRTQMWDGKLLSPTYQRFYFQEKDLTAFWNLVRWTMQGAHERFLTASLRGRKGGIWESLSLGNASWVFDITK